MATYFVASGGSNTAPYDTWAKAATSLQTALTAASTAGDIVVIQYNAVPSGDAELAADTTYATANSVSIISASADDASTAYTPTAMGAANWIGNSTANKSITIGTGADDSIYIYGVTFRTASSPSRGIALGNTLGQSFRCENCYFWSGNTASTSIVQLGLGSSSVWCYGQFIGCTFRAGATGQSLIINGNAEFIGCSLSSSGSTPTTLISAGSTAGPTRTTFIDCDLSLVTNTLVGNLNHPQLYEFYGCKFGTAVTVLATQSNNPTLSSASALVVGCEETGGTEHKFGYYNALGQVTLSTSVYFTSGAAAAAWKIDTSANVTKLTPFVSPWIDLYHTATSAITPYLEILRDTSTTAYKDDEVWSEFSVQTADALGTISGDRAAAGATGSNQAAGAGTGSWTGENANAWSGKVDTGSSVTPNEAAYIRARVCVGVNTSTTPIYVDPQIRT